MGKHERSYARVERDLYPSPPCVIEALAEHVDLHGLTTWEFACGNGSMVEALRLAGCARVCASDIIDYGAGQDEVLDFLSAQLPKFDQPFDLLCTNPPFGQGGRLATAFIEAGLRRLGKRGILALLLPCDFDSAKTRARYFGDCEAFVAKIVLRERVVWFPRSDGIRAAPKENTAWYVWEYRALRIHHPPVILYAPKRERDDPEAR
jgi:hypothetical protein